jgi:hypothetical protein
MKEAPRPVLPFLAPESGKPLSEPDQYKAADRAFKAAIPGGKAAGSQRFRHFA